MGGLLLIFPLLVHAAIVLDSRWLEFAALAALAVNVLYAPLRAGRVAAWVALGAAIVVSAVLVGFGEGRLFLYAESVLAPLVFMWFFARTLMPPGEPMITRIASAIEGPSLPDEVRRYTRHVTELWVATFLLFALLNLSLAVFASALTWSLFANFVIYLLAGAVFMAEWLFRRWYLRGYERQTWREYLHNLRRLNLRELLA